MSSQDNQIFPTDDGVAHKSREKTSKRKIIIVLLVIFLIIQLLPVFFIYTYVLIFNDGEFPEPDYEALILRDKNATISLDQKTLIIDTKYISEITTTIQKMEMYQYPNSSAEGELQFFMNQSKIIPGINFVRFEIISTTPDFIIGEYEIYYYWKNTRDDNRYQSSIFLWEYEIEIETTTP